MDKQTLQERAAQRAELVKSARDSNVLRLADFYLGEFRDALEHLREGDTLEDHVPVGREKFLEWVKNTIMRSFPRLEGILENERTLKDYASQVADQIAKSNTAVENPLKDYVKEQVFKKADVQVSPSQKEGHGNLYKAPVEHTRYCPEHAGAMLRRVKDNVYQCPINGDFMQGTPWKEHYSYDGGHEVKYETGVQNQSSGAWNKVHPIKPFLSDIMAEVELESEDKPYGDHEHEDLYNVFRKNEELITPSAPNEEEKETVGTRHKEADVLGKLTRKAQFFAPTTMMGRQCPDHPGQQTTRLADNVRQCPLDDRVYDFNQGFTTDDGVKHNGGSVSDQNSIPPGSVVVRLDKTSSVQKTAIKGAVGDTPGTHEFLYSVLQHLPGTAERERKILNYKFQKGVSLEQAIAAIKQAEELAAHPQVQPQGTTPAQPPMQQQAASEDVLAKISRKVN